MPKLGNQEPQDPYQLTPEEQRLDDTMGGAGAVLADREISASRFLSRKSDEENAQYVRPERTLFEPMPTDVRKAALDGLKKARRDAKNRQQD